jgi:hypothetical protein
MQPTRRFKLIACEILYREICHCVSRCNTIVDTVFMPKGLHDIGEQKMSARLQEELDKTDISRYSAVLLGYGLCNNGIRGLRSKLPLVVPRAHDCITLLLGSKEKYADYFQKNPGTYFKSTGWMERDSDSSANSESCMSQLGMNRTYQEYAEQYGEENARYLMETMGDWLKNYKKLAYIDTQVGDFGSYKEQTRAEAKERNWEYEELQGSVDLLLRLVNGAWDERDFLIVPPNCTIKSTFDENIISSINV